ncbi:UNVERIFIED_CONTAM: hypothetical protein FKN15_066279 [Acipenser sinensis]
MRRNSPSLFCLSNPKEHQSNTLSGIPSKDQYSQDRNLLITQLCFYQGGNLGCERKGVFCNLGFEARALEQRREREKRTGRAPIESLPYGVEADPIGLRAPENTESSDFSENHYRHYLETGSQLPTGFDPQRTEWLIQSLDVRKKRESERTQIIVSYGTNSMRAKSQ